MSLKAVLELEVSFYFSREKGSFIRLFNSIFAFFLSKYIGSEELTEDVETKHCCVPSFLFLFFVS